MKYKIKYFFESLLFLKALNSPFKPFKLIFYYGNISIGVPYFLPRKWAKDKENGLLKSVPKKFGFNFCSLGWKTKWDETDFRFEWSPVLSFVCFNKQMAIIVQAPEMSQYWKTWLYYEKFTDKKLSQEDRVKQLIKECPNIYTVYKNNSKETVNYNYSILKSKWHYLLKNNAI